MATSRSTGKAGTGAGKAPARAKAPCFTVTVSLEGITRGGATRGEKYAGMKAQARALRDGVVAWLKEQDLKGEFKRVSDVTAFGTFTLQCTPDVMRLLRRAPGVESVIRTGDAPMRLLNAR